MGDIMAEEWSREVEKFRVAARIVLEYLAVEGRIPINEQLFTEVYNDLRKRLVVSRGWWNPLLSPYSVYHLYDQAIMVLSPVSSEAEFLWLYGVRSKDVVELIEEGLLTVLLSAPHTSYSCQCFEDILNAQGVLPTVLRLTETIKAVLSMRREGGWIYNTKYISNMLQEELRLEEPNLSDMATRISDLAALGYVRLARRLINELMRNRGKREVQALVRALHHVLVEPIIDSGATIGVFSKLDLEFIKNIVQSTNDIAQLIKETLWSLGTEAKIRVPRQFSIRKLKGFLEKEDTLRTHRAIIEYRTKLRKLAVTGDLNEVKEIARLAADQMRRANKVFHDIASPSMLLLTLGFIAQVATSLFLPTPSNGLYKLLATLMGVTLSSVTDKGVKKAVEMLLTVDEHVLILPITPMIFEVKIQE